MKPQELWALRFTRSLTKLIEFQDVDASIALAKPEVDYSAAELTACAVGRPKAVAKAFLSVWLQRNDGITGGWLGDEMQGIAAYDVRITIDDRSTSRLRKYERVGSQVFPAAGGDIPLFDCAYALRDDDGKPFAFGIAPGVSASGRFRAPNPLFVCDAAFFLLQMSRILAGRKPLRARIATHATLGSPGRIVSVPGDRSVVSRFCCPTCRNILRSPDTFCVSCDWSLYGSRPRRKHENVYDYELRDT